MWQCLMHDFDLKYLLKFNNSTNGMAAFVLWNIDIEYITILIL
jgi:hypothetical protein